MTQLFIDGIEVVLPQTFTVQVKRENPLITKNGEYTYDITLSLANPVNADLYRHLNRLNSVQPPRTKRKAVLVADNRVYCNGTEVITGWTDKEVSIQLASGNSELNYIIGAGELISTLTAMPDTLPVKHPSYPQGFEYTYPTSQYCVAPVYDAEAGVLINAWGVNGMSPYDYESTWRDRFAQPFLCSYISEMFKAMGYTLTYNQLAESSYKCLYIAQAAHERQWCKMLPGWTIGDFMEQLELLFNGVFVVDNRRREVSFLLRNTYYAGCKSVHVQDVEDIYEAEVEEQPDVEDMANASVSYKLEDADFWRWNCLSETVLKFAHRDVIPVSFTPSPADPRPFAWFMDVAHQKTDTIYTDLVDGQQYLFVRMTAETGISWPVYRRVDRFTQLDKGKDATRYELDIVPVTMDKTVVNWQKSPGVTEDISFYLPTVKSTGAPKTEIPGTLADMINQNTTLGSESKNPVHLAFFSGLQDVEVKGVKCAYPLPYVDSFYLDCNSVLYGMDLWDTPIPNNPLSLRLLDMYTNFYQGGYDIDFRHGVKLTSHDANVYNTRNVFEIRNKRYICAEIEYTLDAQGRKGGWTGTFYPVKMSDTEADARWILADGKWRDGGVWLDNGRWLDG